MNVTNPTSVVMAFTAEQASSLSGISLGQLVAWDKEGFFRPSLGAPGRGVPNARIYTFQDLLSLRVLNALRNVHGCSLRHLREVRDRLRVFGESEWSSTTLYVLNRKVVFDHPITGRKEEIVSGQGVIPIPLSTVVGDLRRDVDLIRKRDVDDIGVIERRRGIASSKPVIAGTRIPVEAIRSLSEAGYSRDAIRVEYPSLTRRDIDVALDVNDAA